MIFPASDERERFSRYGRGLGYTHGEQRGRETPCRTYVYPEDDSRSAPRCVTTRPSDVVTCPRCLAVKP